MSREWKPGDVAMVRGQGMGPVVALRGARGAWVWVDASGKNPQGPGEACYAHESGLTETRPLVVIDPENAEQVMALADAWDDLRDKHAELGPDRLTLSGYRMQAALREFANPTPPKPEEPTGLGAVVEEVDGTRWTRVESAAQPSRNPWYPADDPELQPDEWAGIPAVRVLSEGVQS